MESTDDGTAGHTATHVLADPPPPAVNGMASHSQPRDESVAVPPKKRRITEYAKWGKGTVYAVNVPASKVEAVWAELARKEYGGDGCILQPWPGTTGQASIAPNTRGICVTTRRCWYHNAQCRCKWEAKSELNMLTMTATFYIASLPHADDHLAPGQRKDHVRTDQKRRGLSKYISTALFDSPSTLQLKPIDLIARAERLGFAPDERMQQQIRRKHERLRAKFRAQLS